MSTATIIIISAAALVFLFIIANMKIVPQAHEYVIEFLGKYKTTWAAGFHVLIPFFERMQKELNRVRAGLRATESKLSNEKFTARAPEAVVNAEREKQTKLEALIENLKLNLSHLS